MIIDLMAIDVDGGLHILELKSDRTPRDVVVQVLDYGARVRVSPMTRCAGSTPPFDATVRSPTSTKRSSRSSAPIRWSC